MDLRSFPLHTFASIALLAPITSHAAITVFTTEATFLNAVIAPGVDTFAGFSTTTSTPSPITRNAGAYPYTATSTSSFFGVGLPANPALSTFNDTDTITFSGLGAANAIGGLFFGSGLEGNFVTAGISVTVTDSLGATTTQTLQGSPTSFLGFVSDGTIASLVFATTMPGQFIFPTVDNLTLALNPVVVIPEPETWSLLFAGLAAVGACARRRRDRRR